MKTCLGKQLFGFVLIVDVLELFVFWLLLKRQNQVCYFCLMITLIEYYHPVEEYLQPIEINKRQALFKIPDDLKVDRSLLDSEIDRFSYVMD